MPWPAGGGRGTWKAAWSPWPRIPRWEALHTLSPLPLPCPHPGPSLPGFLITLQLAPSPQNVFPSPRPLSQHPWSGSRDRQDLGPAGSALIPPHWTSLAFPRVRG